MFQPLERRHIEEIKSDLTLYVHEPTGAQLISVENDDENKVFGITFRTPPSDSTGVAHILEHSVLCGSRNYKVKEPFVELLKGSLQTFLNAFTYPDKTCYPVASQNLQDFYNLINVYMDAALYPRLTPETHAQEAWHYELDKATDPLTFKGVVFNEMKGVYSSPDSALLQYAQETLFPDITYGFDSGGRPSHIPDLTHEQLLAFHKRFYHPSNARIWFYGDDDPATRLKLMEEWLRPFQRLEPDSQVPLQRPFAAPRKDVRFVQGDESAKAMSVVSWLLNETTDVNLGLSWEILAHILIGTPAAPLRKALIESGLGEDLAGIGLENQLRQSYFSAGLKGVNPDQLNQVEALITHTLENIASEGLDARTVDAALNTIEFRLREMNTGNFPRGLAIMIRCLGTWLYDGDPFAPLAFEEQFLGIQSLARHGYFEQLIRDRLLNNPHRVRLDLMPDAEVTAKAERAERQRLDAARAQMSEAQISALVAQTEELKRRQVKPDSPEELRKIPQLQLKDIAPKIKTTPQREETLEGVKTFVHPLSTSGIVYFDLGFNLSLLPERLLPYTNLIGRALLEMGTKKEDFVALDQRIGTETGGIEAEAMFASRVEDRSPVAHLFLRGKAIAPKLPAMLNIYRDVLTGTKFDNPERFTQILLEEKADLESRLIPSGHAIVNKRLASMCTAAGAMSERTSGVEYLLFTRELARRVETDWAGVLKDLRELQQRLLHRGAAVCQITTDEALCEASLVEVEELFESLPLHTPSASPPPHGARRGGMEGLAAPSQVNFVGMAASLLNLGYALHGSALVIARHLRNGYLWERVRVQGGAYGGMCWFDPVTSVFSFASYRDPNLTQTLEAYAAAGDYLARLSMDAEELTKAIIGAIGDMDQYQLPDARGFNAMLRALIGNSDARRQKTRDEILGTTLEDFHRFGELMRQFPAHASTVVLGSKDALAALPDATILTLLQ